MGHHSDSKTTYKREFFDREYSAKEAYSRLWGFTRKYRFRIYLGIVCGMLLDKVGAVEVNGQNARSQSCGQEARHPDVVADGQDARHAGVPAATSKEERKVLKEYGKFKKLAQKLGFELQDENEALGAPLLFAILVIVPLAAMARCAFLFLNKYCLSWAALHTVKDLRCAILRHIQEQSMQFHGRIDVGQLMSRASSDPRLVQNIIQQVLQEVAEAPFEIVVSVGFIIWTAIRLILWLFRRKK